MKSENQGNGPTAYGDGSEGATVAGTGAGPATFGAVVPGAHHVELVSGRFLDLADPSSDDITLEAVAHGLSNTCRFAGQSSRFYSVAEHAQLCAAYVRAIGGDERSQLAALHHDDHEAFMGDVTRPLKALMPGYGEMADHLQGVIARALRLPTVRRQDATAVKWADDWALSAEAYYLMPSKGATWFCAGLYEPALPVVEWVDSLGLSPASARLRWLGEHERLTRSRPSPPPSDPESERLADGSRPYPKSPDSALPAPSTEAA